jgi:hypothetical protein
MTAVVNMSRMLTGSGAFDQFVSYSRLDNQEGWVTALVEAIADEYKQFSCQPLRSFVDTCDIRVMDD